MPGMPKSGVTPGLKYSKSAASFRGSSGTSQLTNSKSTSTLDSDSKSPAAPPPANSISLLPPATLRWINKRRVAGEDDNAKILSGSTALQLKTIFRSLDFDGSGEIEIKELKEAINYVAKSSEGGTPLIDNPEKINSFFESMDLDGNGAVDLNEFMIGMTASNEENGVVS